MKYRVFFSYLVVLLLNEKAFASCSFSSVAQGSEYLDSVQKIEVQNIKDFGKRGYVFNIKEESFLDFIKKKLKLAEKSGKIKQLQQEFKEKVSKKIKRPNQVNAIKHTNKARIFYFDPTYIQNEDIKDNLGNIIIEAGTKINPLEHLSWGEPLIFIDGDDIDQVIRAKAKLGKIILVKGSPLKLQEQHKIWFYFDQAGILTEKFDIKQVPAIVTQEGLKLKISEIKL